MLHPLPDVLARHPEVTCLSHPAIRAALDAGRFTVTAAGLHRSTMELLSTYEVRARHLSKVPGSYARQLRQSTLAFCEALERQAADCKVALTSINFETGLVIDLWERVDTGELLGCNVCYDHRIMTESDWERLWGPG